jgi:hypothetical protein
MLSIKKAIEIQIIGVRNRTLEVQSIHWCIKYKWHFAMGMVCKWHNQGWLKLAFG